MNLLQRNKFRENYQPKLLEPIAAGTKAGGAKAFGAKAAGATASGVTAAGVPSPLSNGTKRASSKIISCELFISIGTSLQVYPAAGLPKLAKENGANLVIINNEPTPFDQLADLVIHDQISDVFKDLKI